jgi:hypothetical protein
MCCFYFFFTRTTNTLFDPAFCLISSTHGNNREITKDGDQLFEREANRGNLWLIFFVTVKVLPLKTVYKPCFV